MPIHARLTYSQGIYNFPDVEPSSEPLRIIHHDVIKPYVLVISCNADDQGGLVYRENLGINHQTNSPDMANDLPEVAEIETAITPTAFYEREIMTGPAGDGILTLTHFVR